MSVAISGAVDEILQAHLDDTDSDPTSQATWGWYDGDHGLYRLFVEKTGGGQLVVVANLVTGEWGLDQYPATLPRGCFANRLGRDDRAEGLFIGDQSGQLYSTSSRLSRDAQSATTVGSPVVSTFRSEPVGMDLPLGRKQVTGAHLDYKAYSASTGTLSISSNFGNSFPSGYTVSLPAAAKGNVVQVDVNQDGPGIAMQWQSTSTGYELHRAELTIGLRGRL